MGLIGMIVAMKFNYKKLRSLAIPLMILTLAALVLIFTPLGIGAKGSIRSLGTESIHIAPAEVAKLTLILFLAKYMDANIGKIKFFYKGVLPVLGVTAVVCGLILAQPDLGTSVTLAGTVFFMLVAAGARWNHMGLLTISGLGLIAGAIIMEPYRAQRFLGFLDPWKYPQGIGYQTIQSLYALGSGGLFGLGLGRSRQKYFYLPEKHTDFIFAILGEELGFLGVIVVLALFVLIAWRGYKIALNAPDNFGNLLATGITTVIIFQALINIGVVAGCLPVTGITLPFISYGGSSLLFSMIGIGLLLNVSRYSSGR
jgi:cell division protein FtsW